MPKYPAIDQTIVPVQVPKTINIPAKRECLAAVCAVMKKFGPGVITAMLQMDTTLKSINIWFIICIVLFVDQKISSCAMGFPFSRSDRKRMPTFRYPAASTWVKPWSFLDFLTSSPIVFVSMLPISPWFIPDQGYKIEIYKTQWKKLIREFYLLQKNPK